MFPGACGSFPHGRLSGVVEQCANVANGASKALLFIAVQAARFTLPLNGMFIAHKAVAMPSVR